MNSENIGQKETGFSYKKEERLCSKKVIDQLFSKGNTFLAFPFKVVFLEMPLSKEFPVQAGFSVGKRNFKKAVKRNLIKRKMREAYRLNKHILYSGLKEKQLAIFFIYIGKTVPEFMICESAMKKSFKQLLNEVSL